MGDFVHFFNNEEGKSFLYILVKQRMGEKMGIGSKQLKVAVKIEE